MQMVNTFEILNLQYKCFNIFFKTNVEWDLLIYLYNNLKKENFNTLKWDLKTALTTNASGKYI
jgi:hypothetical protein